MGGPVDNAGSGHARQPGMVDAIETARLLYRWRRCRDAAFEAHGRLFAEPAWDVLLDLLLSENDGRPVSVTDACLGSANPNTTASRHLRRLERAGLVMREADPADARRAWLRLTGEGRELLLLHLDDVRADLDRM